MTKEDAQFCSTRDAAQVLGVSLRTVQLWVESGVLRAWKTAGGHRRIVRASVDALIRQRQAAVHRAAQDATFCVLVVEDEPDLLKLYELNVAGWNLPLRLVTARNGFEGLLRIGESRPHLLITDLNMPGMDGFRMIRSLRANPEYRDMDIVVVTALGKSEIQDRGGLPEDVLLFTKPAPFSQLEKIVRGKIGVWQTGGAPRQAAARV